MSTYTKTVRRPQVILLVEDSPQDRESTKRAFTKSKVINPIIECEDGDKALDYLFRRNKFSNPGASPRPGIILLDLNMPGTDGFEVLAEIKKDNELKKIPVIVLTTSSDERDIDKCYSQGANSYVQKPVDLHAFLKAVGRLQNYWLEIAILPKMEE